jgi:NADH-quinone oxidoreductase subunit F
MANLILTRDRGSEPSVRLSAYLERGGYQALRTALTQWTPGKVVDEVKTASLRGRGGAGFPAGLKWSFVPQTTDKPKYLCVNADEGEPGTFKDRFLMTHDPHLLIEGAVIAAYAVGIHAGYIYIRGEYEAVARRMDEATAEAYAHGVLGKNILGLGFDFDLWVHRGAGAYICGEETAMLESLEGKRGVPRLKPPFPASVGLFGCPTVINNVETLACVPVIIRKGAAWFLENGRPKDGGTRLFSLSGAVHKPGVYELPAGTSLREIIFDHAGGLKPGAVLKAVIPGGLSAPVLRADEIDVPMDVDSLAAAGSMLGSAAVIVIDAATPMLSVLEKVAKFYEHESCGQCTPCRIGTSWIRRVVKRMIEHRGKAGDIDLVLRLATNIKGRTLCPFGDAAALPILSIIRKFKAELEASLRSEGERSSSDA